jgi:hypothetical protein
MIQDFMKKILPDRLVNVGRRELHKETHINRALRSLEGQIYVEIGINRGNCFKQISAPRKIGIDPAPKDFGTDLAPGELFFKTTSDTFFADHSKEALGSEKVDVAFVDGLHEFPQALRDVLNLEMFMSDRGVLFIHDCIPPTRRHTEQGVGASWTGDVWKVIYYLATYRPDLSFFTLDCDWGLGVVTGFHPILVPGFPSPQEIETCQKQDYSLLENHRSRTLRLRPAWYSYYFFNFDHPRTIKSSR